MDVTDIRVGQRLWFTASPDASEEELTDFPVTVTAVPDPENDDDVWVQVTCSVYVKASELHHLED